MNEDNNIVLDGTDNSSRVNTESCSEFKTSNLILEIKNTNKKTSPDLLLDTLKDHCLEHDFKKHTSNQSNLIKAPNEISKNKKEALISNYKSFNRINDYKKEFMNILNFDERVDLKHSKLTKDKTNYNKSSLGDSFSNYYSNKKLGKTKYLKSSSGNKTLEEITNSFFNNDKSNIRIKGESNDVLKPTAFNNSSRPRSTLLKDYNNSSKGINIKNSKYIGKNSVNNNSINNRTLNEMKNKKNYNSVSNYVKAEIKEINLYEEHPILEDVMSLKLKLKQINEKEFKKLPER